MAEQTTPPPGDTGDAKDKTPPAGDTADAKDKAPMIPKARLDQEIAKRRAVEEQLEAVATELAADVPEEYRELIPTGLTAAERIKWMRQAAAKGLFTAATPPPTDQTRPKLTKPAPNVDALSPAQKMASGYGQPKR